MSLQTVKEGLLYKRGKINTEWRQRLFILNGKHLTYFKGGKHTPSGVIELRDIREVSEILEDGSFQLNTSSRVFEIRGETEDISQGWIDTIRQQIKESRQQTTT